MDIIQLLNPTLAYADDILAFRSEVEAANDADSFAGCSFLRNCATAEEWLKVLAERENPATLSNGAVPSNAYLAVRMSDNRIVGMIDLRHHIDHPILGLWGGHMGYTVRPSERGKGYAAEMLRLKSRKLPLTRHGQNSADMQPREPGKRTYYPLKRRHFRKRNLRRRRIHQTLLDFVVKNHMGEL